MRRETAIWYEWLLFGANAEVMLFLVIGVWVRHTSFMSIASQEVVSTSSNTISMLTPNPPSVPVVTELEVPILKDYLPSQASVTQHLPSTLEVLPIAEQAMQALVAYIQPPTAISVLNKPEIVPVKDHTPKTTKHQSTITEGESSGSKSQSANQPQNKRKPQQ